MYNFRFHDHMFKSVIVHPIQCVFITNYDYNIYIYISLIKCVCVNNLWSVGELSGAILPLVDRSD